MAIDVNCVVLIGRLTRDPEMRYTNSGLAILSMSIAVNSRRKDGDSWIDEANYFDVSYFGKGAESIKPYIAKGKQVAVQGSLKQDRWEKDGQKFSKVTVRADSVELLGGRTDNGGQFSSNGGYQQSQSSFMSQSAQSAPSSYAPVDDNSSFGGDSESFPDDIPF